MASGEKLDKLELFLVACSCSYLTFKNLKAKTHTVTNSGLIFVSHQVLSAFFK